MYRVDTENADGSRARGVTEYKDEHRAAFAAELKAVDVPESVTRVLLVHAENDAIICTFSPIIAKQQAWERRHGFKPINYTETGARP
ncbi:MAG: hypothetical protein WC322_03375 [Candidatus Paceibacterota bacterium]|jgi:hypothetical protein